jgi:hypothetical protein
VSEAKEGRLVPSPRGQSHFPRTRDRFLALPAHSKSQPCKAAKGRLDPFTAPFGYDRYLRILAIASRSPKGWNPALGDVLRIGTKR